MRQISKWLFYLNVLAGPCLAFAVAACGSAPSQSEGEDATSATEAIEWGALDDPNRTAVGMLSTSGGSTKCSATLLPEKLNGGLPQFVSSTVLTAAHCRDTNTNTINLAFNVGTDSSNFVRHQVDAVSVSFHRDLMMLHLATPVELPPTLPGHNDTYPISVSSPPPVGTHCTAVGYGYHHLLEDTNANCLAANGCITGVRYSAEASVSEVSGSSDLRIYTRGVTGQTDHGDSGGPLLCGGRIAGVLSSGPAWPFPVSAQVSYTAVDAGWVNTNWDVAPPTVNHSLYMVNRDTLYRTNALLGNYQRISVVGEWANTTAMAAVNGGVYAVQDGWLVQVDPGGSPARIGSQVWAGTTAIAALNSSLYLVQGGKLWRVSDFSTGARVRVGTWTWNATSMIGTTWSNGTSLLWIISGDRLWWLDVATLASGHSGTDWAGPTSMTQIDTTPYIFHDNAIWRIDSRFPLTWTAVGAEDWSATQALTSLDGTLLVVDHRYLQRLPVDGNLATPLQHGDWPPANFPNDTAVVMTALP